MKDIKLGIKRNKIKTKQSNQDKKISEKKIKRRKTREEKEIKGTDKQIHIQTNR